MRGYENKPGEAALTRWLQMRKTSNPKTWICSRTARICSLSSRREVDRWCTWLSYSTFLSLRLFSFLLSSALTVTVTLTDLPTSSVETGGGRGITETQNQIIHGAPLLNMWLTHWEPLWEIRLKNELFIRTQKAGPIGCREWKNTPTIYPKQHYNLDHDTFHRSYSFLSSSRTLPFIFWYWNMTLGKIAW